MTGSLSGTPYELRVGNATARVASVGASLRELRVGDRDLVVPFAEDEVRPAHRGALLAPWPNRVIDGRYSFRGRDYQLSLTEPARGNALHGLMVWVDFDASDVSPERVELSALITPQLAYPWCIRVSTVFSLDDEGLTQEVRATNESEVAAPWGTAAHPYLRAGRGTVDDWTMELSASHVLETVAPSLAPSGIREVTHDPDRFDFRSPKSLRGIELDHCFTGLVADSAGAFAARLRAADGSGVGMTWTDECRWVQVHTADRPDPAESRVGLAVEPMTCAPDAFNDARYAYDTGLIVLEPGATSVARWRVHAI